MKGLDYGCGPEPVLSALLEREGFECAFYDPYFFPHLDECRVCDFIFSTECFEHFIYPSRDIDKISGLIAKNGFLIVMTRFWSTAEEFPGWYYARDFTHVSFYREQTMDYIAARWGFDKVYCDGVSVTVYKKGAS